MRGVGGDIVYRGVGTIFRFLGIVIPLAIPKILCIFLEDPATLFSFCCSNRGGVVLACYFASYEMPRTSNPTKIPKERTTTRKIPQTFRTKVSVEIFRGNFSKRPFGLAWCVRVPITTTFFRDIFRFIGIFRTER